MVSFSDDELLLFISKFEFKTLHKNEFLIREGEANRYVAFLNKGLLKMYTEFEGEEMIYNFFIGGCWMADYPSFLKRSPAQMNIKAITDCEILLLSYDSIQQLYNAGKNFEKFGRVLAEDLFMEVMEHNISLLRETPESRYRQLLQEQPALFEHVPLSQIASFLGIKPESLSRIRKRLSSSLN